MEGIMTATQQLVLFWVFVAFFMIIGIIAILAIVGVIKTDKKFRNWAVGGFAAAIVGVVILWAKTQSPQIPLDFYVNLEPPANVKADTFELESGTYEYDEQSRSGKSIKHSGSVELTAGQNMGWWTAKIPCYGMTKSFRITFNDKNGNRWKVLPFYPNYHNQVLIPIASPLNKTATFLPNLSLTRSAFAIENKTKIRFNNYARPISTTQGRNYYNWRVFVDEPIRVLTQISEVQYLLHPTFPNPLQVRSNPDDQFALENSGWGQFTIQITIRYKDHSTETTSYYLDLTKRWP
jgi:hypothetical protein